jgi:hypothetical protein
MKDIPWGAILSRPTGAGVLVAKTIDYEVPDRLELLNHHVLAKGNPNVVNHQRTKMEIRKLKIICLIYGGGVLPQTVPQRSPFRGIERQSAFSRTLRHGLANINGLFKDVVSILVRYWPIWLEIAGVINRINSRPNKVRRFRKRGHRTQQKGLGHAATEICLIERIVWNAHR